MRVRIFLYALPFVLFFAACTSKDKSFKIVGDIEGMPEQQVSLHALGIDDRILVVDSTQTNAEGHFELTGEGEEPSIYQLRFSGAPGRFVMLSLDKGTAKLKGKWQFLEESYNVEGSAPSSSLRTLLQVVREHMRDANTYGIVADSARAQGKDSMLANVSQDMADLKQHLTEYIEAYADTTKFLANALFAVRILNPKTEEPYLTTFVQGLERRFPNSGTAQAFTVRYKQMLAAQNAEQPAAATGPGAGMEAKEIALPTPDGKQVTLSSFRGKYVLVDFWASWCGPCRHENPAVVAAYNKFKAKNFTILGVSLDDDKEDWMNAIKKDGLVWTHVSDLQRWESIAARDYGIQAIPANFLVDPQGKIIARDLHGAALEQKLAEVLQ